MKRTTMFCAPVLISFVSRDLTLCRGTKRGRYTSVPQAHCRSTNWASPANNAKTSRFVTISAAWTSVALPSVEIILHKPHHFGSYEHCLVPNWASQRTMQMHGAEPLGAVGPEKGSLKNKQVKAIFPCQWLVNQCNTTM